jgi:hypothetical protein
VCPANNKPIAEVITGNVEDYESCVKAAEEAWQVIEKVGPFLTAFDKTTQLLNLIIMFLQSHTTETF